MTLIRVKSRRISNLYVLVVYAPGSRRKVLARRVARRPWTPLDPGDVLREGRRRMRVTAVERHVERRGDVVEHVTLVFTRGRHVPRPSNVVRMPMPDPSVVAQFIRFHVLMRVYDGDPDAWLAALDARADSGDVRFLRWMRTRLRHDPAMLAGIREMVDTTAFWPSVVGCR